MRRLTVALSALIVAACGGPSAEKLEALINDCRTRALASGGLYDAAFKVCVTDRGHLKGDLLSDVWLAESFRTRALAQGSRRERWKEYVHYTDFIRMTKHNGVDSAGIEKMIRSDSSAVADLP